MCQVAYAQLLKRRSDFDIFSEMAIMTFLAGEVSELADERDLGSRGAIRESSSLSFPMPR